MFYLNLNYDYLHRKYHDAMKYCLRYSDTFSVITYFKKPYSKRIITDVHQKSLQEWEPYLIEQCVGINEWPGTETRNWHNVMNVYSSREFRKNVECVPNLFSPLENDFPEDFSFYRGENPWLITVSHEKIAYMTSATVQDLNFFKDNGIIR